MIALLIILLLSGCSMSEILEQAAPRTKSDTTYTPRQKDNIAESGIPIAFEVSVEDWDNTEI